MLYAKSQLHSLRFTHPVRMSYTWYEPNRRRDKDNVSSFGRKCIQDALVRLGILRNDGWAEIDSFSDAFAVDKNHPRIVVEIEEVSPPKTIHTPVGAGSKPVRPSPKGGKAKP